MTERDDDREFRDLLAAVERLPQSVEPARDLWPEIDARIRASAWRRWTVVALAGAAALALVIARWGGVAAPSGAWEVARIAGAPRVAETPLGGSGLLRVGEWVETDDSSRALIFVGDIGQVDVKPGTRVRLVEARATDHRLALARGAIFAQGGARPRLFFVAMPAGGAPGPGLAHGLEGGSSGNGLFHRNPGDGR